MASIELEAINKVYPNGFHAVHDLDLKVADGEFMVLVGPSGLRQDDRAADGRRPGGDQLGDAADRRRVRGHAAAQETATSRWSFRTTRCTRT